MTLTATLADPDPNAVIAVFGRDDEPSAKGCSVVIPSPGWAALRCIDPAVSKRLRRLAAPIKSVSILPMEDGGLPAAPGFARVPLTPRACRWHDVRTALAARVQDVCGEDTLRLDCRLASLAEATVGDGFTLTFEQSGADVDEGKSVWRGIAQGEDRKGVCSALNGVAFLGDAAHPVRPTGEGVTLAFQDAWQLGAIVKASPDLLPDADMLRCYEAASLPRVRYVTDKVRAVANDYYKADEGTTGSKSGRAPEESGQSGGSPRPNKKAAPRFRPKPL